MAPDPVSFRAVMEERLTDRRKPQGKRHPLASLVSVLVAGLAAARAGALAVAQRPAGTRRSWKRTAAGAAPGPGC